MTPSDGVWIPVKLKSVLLAVILAPISTKLFASSTESILVLAKLVVVLLILLPSIFYIVKNYNQNFSRFYYKLKVIFFQ